MSHFCVYFLKVIFTFEVRGQNGKFYYQARLVARVNHFSIIGIITKPTCAGYFNSTNELKWEKKGRKLTI